MQRKAMKATPGIAFFALFVFVLTAAPRMNVKFGPVPLYFIDVLIVILLAMAQSLPRVSRGQRLFGGTILFILALAILSELVGIVRFETLQESIYIIFRTILAFSVFYICTQFVRTLRDVEIVLRAVVLGLLVTASLMILTSLPMTRAAVTDLVFSNRFLEPAAGQVTETFVEGPDRGVRGRTLVGVSILGASFINACWPLAALLLRWPWPVGPWRTLALAACLLAPMGVLMSYSRGPILGSILIVLVALLLGLRHVRRGVIVPVVIGTVIVLSVGVGSQLFFFDRLINRTQAMLEAPTQDERESERYLAYVEPFEHVASHPRFLLLGEGITIRFTNSNLETPEMLGQATHALPAVAYYAYGMIAAILYISLLSRALLFAGPLATGRRNSVTALLAQPFFLSVVALLPLAAFGHAFVSTPRGAMLFFLILGLVSALARFRAPVPRRQPMRQGYAHRRYPAFG